MNWLDVLLGREQSLNQAEEELGKPDEVEATNLSYHVHRCAARWILSFRMSRSNNSQLMQLRLLVFILLALEGSRQVGLPDFVKTLLHP